MTAAVARPVNLVKRILKGTTVEPRPYQERIVTKTIDMFMGRHRKGNGELQPNSRSVLLESPTGSGKTVMALMAIKGMIHENPNLYVGWVAMRRNLLEQAARENQSKGLNNDIDFVSMFEKEPEGLRQAKEDGRPIMLVVDEAQHDAASSMAHLHNFAEPQFILGMTATPFRTDRVKLTFDSVVKDCGIHQLISDGYLSKYHHYSIDNWEVETVAKTYLRDTERWGKTAIYFVNLTECYECFNTLRRNGILCDVVTGDTDVEAQIEAFRNDEVHVLINCLKLTEGWDEPSLQTAFIRDSGKGPTIQMGGRAFRAYEKLKYKQIVQSKLTRWPFLRTALPEQQYTWQEDMWLSLTINPRLNLINQNARLAIAQTEVELPKFLDKRKGRRKVRF